jgi:hypothetical protein
MTDAELASNSIGWDDQAMEEPMTLTKEQERAVESGEAVPVQVGKAECVVIRKDVFERVTAPVYDDGDLTDDELHAIAARTLDDLNTAGQIP